MAWTLGLDQFTHDLSIKGGKFVRVNGSDEVRQRVKVAVWHYIEEYFLNIPNGVPWYEQILGRKENADLVSLILRQRILRVPGVIRIVTFEVDYDSLLRRYSIESRIDVESGPGEISTITLSETVNNQVA